MTDRIDVTFPLTSRVTAPGDRPTVRAYVSLFAVLFAGALAGRLASAGVNYVTVRTGSLFPARLVGAVVYAALGLAAVGTVYAAVRRRGAPGDPLRRDELATLGGAATIGLLFAAYVLHGALDLPPFPEQLVTTFLNGPVIAGLLVAAYASARELPFRTDPPERERVGFAAAAVLVAGAVGLVLAIWYAVASTAAAGPVLDGFFGPELTAGRLLGQVLLPAVFVGVGWALLYNGAVQETLERHHGRAGTLAATAALVASYGSVAAPLAAGAGPARSAVGSTVAVLLGLLAAYVAALGADRITRSSDGVPAAPVATTAGVVVVAVPLLGLSAAGLVPGQFAAGAAALGVVTAVGAVGYDRCRSLWVPALAFAAFLAASDVFLVRFLASLAG